MIAWFLLAHFSFYATSHQPTLSQIDWHAAFVGRQSTSMNHSNIISGLLVLFNTFGGPILIFISYPLLSCAGSCLYAKFPALLPQLTQYVPSNGTPVPNPNPIKLNSVNYVLQRAHDFELNRGDLNLFNNSHIFLSAVFKTGVQIITLQGLRVRFFSYFFINNMIDLLILSYTFFFKDFHFNVSLYNSLSPLDGMENICTKIHI